MHNKLIQLIIILSAFIAFNAHAQRCEKAVANLESLEGKGSYKSQTEDTWSPVTVGFKFCYGDTLRIEEFRAALRLENETLVRLNEGSVVRFVPPKKSFWLELVDGAAHFISRTPKKFTVKMPYLNAGVDGTEFVVQHEADKDTVAVFEGLVTVANEVDQIQLSKLEQVSGTADSSLQNKIKISIEGVVDWALRYPPTLLHYSAIPDSVYQKIQNNNIDAAITELENLDPNASLFHTQLLQASLYLHQGKISKAKTALNNAQTLDAQANDLKAIQALITLIEGDSQRALKQSQEIIDSGAHSPLTLLVHSYTLQANFKLEEALDFAEQAAEKQANSYVIWNRVAELALNTNYVKKAEKALDKASRLNSDNADTLTLQGFIQLKKYKFKSAKKYFQQAIAVDNDSFANFALGLVTIRLGDLEPGRELIELAVILDPNNSLYRSYLGKAYADEYRFKDAQEQYELAKNLDPNDPTPYFYEALRLRALNQPHLAIGALNDSIEKNDNRAIYRSRYMLDSDTAARNASLASIYLDLGFDEQAQMLAGESLTKDPMDFAAHKFYAESLFNNHQVDATRVSEILQAQLLQPVTANPIRPSLAESDLNVPDIAGPTHISLNEYNSVFNRNEHNASIYTSKGSNSTDLVNVFLSGLEGNTSYALEHYDYQTDGFRENNDQRIRIDSAFIKTNITKDESILIEFRNRTQQRGDISVGNANTQTQNNLRINENFRTFRTGFESTPSKNITILSTASLTKFDDLIDDYSFIASTPNFDVFQDYNFKSEKEHATLEARVDIKNNFFSTSTGLKYKDIKENINRTVQAIGPPNNPPPQLLSQKSKSQVKEIYTQASVSIIQGLEGQGSIRYFKYENLDELIYSAAVNYYLNKSFSVTTAYFEQIKPPAIIEGTLTPTNILGIPILYDDFDLSQSENFVIKSNYRFNQSLTIGAFASERKVDFQSIRGDANSVDVRDNSLYINWSSKNISVIAKFTENEEQLSFDVGGVRSTDTPILLETKSIPIEVTLSLSNTTKLKLEHLTHTQKSTKIVNFQESPKKTKSTQLNIGLYYKAIDVNKNKIQLFAKMNNILDDDISYQNSIVLDKSPRPQNLFPSTYYSIGFAMAL